MSVETLGLIVICLSAGTLFGFVICALMVNAKREDDGGDPQYDEKRRIVERIEAGVVMQRTLDLDSGRLTVTVMPRRDDGGDR